MTTEYLTGTTIVVRANALGRLALLRLFEEHGPLLPPVSTVPGVLAPRAALSRHARWAGRAQCRRGGRALDHPRNVAGARTVGARPRQSCPTGLLSSGRLGSTLPDATLSRPCVAGFVRRGFRVRTAELCPCHTARTYAPVSVGGDSTSPGALERYGRGLQAAETVDGKS